MEFHCINLDRRKDGKISIIEQFAKQNLNIKFFNGLDGKQLGIKSKLRTSGMTGCFISHYLLYTQLQSQNNEWNAIIEDDLVVCDDLLYHMELWLKTIPNDADIAFFGYYARPKSSSKQITKDWLTISDFYGTHFYLVKTSSLPKIINLTSVIDDQIDIQIIKCIQKGDLKGYCSVIPLGRQSGSETDVQKF